MVKIRFDRRGSKVLIRWLYTLVGYLVLPGIIGRLLVRGARNPAYLYRWGERLGWTPFTPLQGSLWVHAVSLGEVQAALPLIRGLQQRYPDWPLVVTTTTPTGSMRAQEELGESVYHTYLPLDLPGPVHRFLHRAQPRLALIMETELWPNLFATCHRQAIPLLECNARLSPHSFQGYQWLKALIQPTLACCSAILTQTPADAKRFRQLGAPTHTLQVIGNLKFELQTETQHWHQGYLLRKAFGKDRFIWLAASTHAGEEGQVLNAHKLIREHWPKALLILTPRHPERFQVVAELCRDWGLFPRQRSLREMPSPDDPVYLADTLGELPLLYAASEVAFVGGSLVPIGGHNLLEPAAMGAALITGPHISNFAAIASQLADQGALRWARSAQELADTVLTLGRDPKSQSTMRNRAQAVVAANRGVLEATLDQIARFLSPSQACSEQSYNT